MADDTPTLAPAAASSATPAAASKSNTVRLAVPWPHTSFDSGIEGVPIITNQGTDVPANLAAKAKAAYRRAFGVDEIEPTTDELVTIEQEA